MLLSRHFLKFNLIREQASIKERTNVLKHTDTGKEPGVETLL